MKSFLLASATLVLSASLAFGDDPCNPHPLRPDGQTNCLLKIESALLKSAMDEPVRPAERQNRSRPQALLCSVAERSGN